MIIKLKHILVLLLWGLLQYSFAYNEKDSLLFFNQQIQKFEKLNQKAKLLETLIHKSEYLLRKGDIDNALIEANQALVEGLNIGSEYYLEKAYRLLSKIHLAKGLYFESTEYLRSGYQYSKAIKDSAKISWYLSTLSEVEVELGKLNDAIEININAINFFKQLNDTLNLGRIYISQGIIHTEFGNFATAKSYLENAIAFCSLYNDSLLIGKAYIALAANHLRQKRYIRIEQDLKKARLYLSKYTKEYLRSKTLEAEYKLNQNKTEQAITIISNVIEKQTKIGDKIGKINSLLLHGKSYSKQKDYNEAKTVFEACLKDAKNLSLSNISRQVFRELSIIEEKNGNISKAHQYIKRYISITDSLYNIQKISEANRFENLATIRQKEKEIQEQREVLLRNESLLNKSRFRQAMLIAFVVFLLTLFVLSYNAYRNKQKANQLLAEQNKKIESQKNLLEQRTRDINDSLNYAKRIQRAIFQTSEMPTKYFDESFLIFIPKELVSGDFYWFKKVEKQVLFAIADCTGHGAPGAFMSIIGMFGLNQIVNELKESNPSDVLQNLNELFNKSFEQKEGSEIFDGMDIAFCSFSIPTKEVRFAGANIFLHVVRKTRAKAVSNTILSQNEAYTLYQVKGERQSIGYKANNEPFTTHSIQLEKDDIIYIFTDGFTDQFGGPKGKKYRLTEFRNLLIEIAHLPMVKQKDYLIEHFSNWKGDNIQVDDVTILGIKVS
ncbi:MAG: hypothetical protein PWR03_1462 [Tenuifilum sp.]|jgi:serine phosphatase RsbU (regulator of sigma subunit)|uniref:SpoIIE family protein phosphatase n=1 Tax=Tenuifilum sp. TaxID=2760880 RepID=UPI0024ABEC26|nr:SpoIIE family protein phosphatase [Tenuifilum sp.]MDI3527279.1 hypothetical protein [Tenuifilum sp.]